MNTVTFSDKNSYEDFGLVLGKKQIGEAVARTKYVNVPARDGVLDFTEAFGEVTYENRTLVFWLQYIGADSDWLATLSALTNYLQGRKHKIFIEPDYYWEGRCVVKAADSDKGLREIEVECDCGPYKKRLEDTIIEVTASGADIVKTIMNDRRTVTPKITVLSGAPTLSWTDQKTGATFTQALPSDFDNKILDFRFYEGVNAFTLSGTGSIRLTYREESL